MSERISVKVTEKEKAPVVLEEGRKCRGARIIRLTADKSQFITVYIFNVMLYYYLELSSNSSSMSNSSSLPSHMGSSTSSIIPKTSIVYMCAE